MSATIEIEAYNLQIGDIIISDTDDCVATIVGRIEFKKDANGRIYVETDEFSVSEEPARKNGVRPMFELGEAFNGRMSELDAKFIVIR